MLLDVVNKELQTLFLSYWEKLEYDTKNLFAFDKRLKNAIICFFVSLHAFHLFAMDQSGKFT
jgi:hypothetical protein